MSERIQQMIREHGFLPDQDLHDFALLVVKECVEVLTEPTNDSEWDGYNRATACAIEEHFGVR